MELGHWVTGSMGHLGHLSRPGHPVTGSSFWLGVIPEFSRFSKKCTKCKTYIGNADMTKVIAKCLLLDWNHWMSVHAINFNFYLWLLKILCPEKWEYFFTHKKLSYRRGTARCVVSIEILPIATQQCRNYLYDKSWTNRWYEVGDLVGGNAW